MSAPAAPGVDAPAPGAEAWLLYDGVCGLCHGWVQFLLRRDGAARLRYAPLQGAHAAAALRRHGRDAAALDTVCLLQRPGSAAETLLTRSSAVLAAVALLGGAWRLVGLLRAVPRPLRDAAYTAVARIRYRVWGRLAACPVPTPAQRHLFLE